MSEPDTYSEAVEVLANCKRQSILSYSLLLFPSCHCGRESSNTGVGKDGRRQGRSESRRSLEVVCGAVFVQEGKLLCRPIELFNEFRISRLFASDNHRSSTYTAVSSLSSIAIGICGSCAISRLSVFDRIPSCRCRSDSLPRLVRVRCRVPGTFLSVGAFGFRVVGCAGAGWGHFQQGEFQSGCRSGLILVGVNW